MIPRAQLRLWTLGPVATALLAWGVHAAFALPSAPSSVWADTTLLIGCKPWADVRLTPEGEFTPVPGNHWFLDADGTYAAEGAPWSPAMRIAFECPTPISRQALQHLLHARHDSWSVTAEYRTSGETVVAGRRTWARYVGAD